MSERTPNTKRYRIGLTKPIAIVLCLKIAAVFCLWLAFFGPDKRMDQTAENVAAGILDRPVASSSTLGERP